MTELQTRAFEDRETIGDLTAELDRFRTRRTRRTIDAVRRGIDKR